MSAAKTDVADDDLDPDLAEDVELNALADARADQVEILVDLADL